MKKFINYLLESLINEAYQSSSLSELMSLADKKEYEDDYSFHKYDFRVISKLTDTYPISKKQISKLLSLANWKEEWFYSYDNKKLFNQEELCKILKISEKDINAKYLKDTATKKSTCLLLFTENNDNRDIHKIIAGLILDPKYSNESFKYLQNMSKTKEEREENRHNNDKLKTTDYIEWANKELKEFNKKASKEQIDLLNKTVSSLMKFTKRGQIGKNMSKEFNDSTEYNDARSIITYYLLKGESEKLIKYFEWEERLNNKQKDYLEEVCDKLKID